MKNFFTAINDRCILITWVGICYSFSLAILLYLYEFCRTRKLKSSCFHTLSFSDHRIVGAVSYSFYLKSSFLAATCFFSSHCNMSLFIFSCNFVSPPSRLGCVVDLLEKRNHSKSNPDSGDAESPREVSNFAF